MSHHHLGELVVFSHILRTLYHTQVLYIAAVRDLCRVSWYPEHEELYLSPDFMYHTVPSSGKRMYHGRYVLLNHIIYYINAVYILCLN